MTTSSSATSCSSVNWRGRSSAISVRRSSPYFAVSSSRSVLLSPPTNDRLAVVDVVLQDLFERQGPRLLVDEREHVEVEGGLHRCVLVEVVEYAVGAVVALDLDDDAHALAVALVADVADAR